MGHRKQAPQVEIDPPSHVHPDWFWSMSGGIDSTAAYLLTKDALHENYSKRPVMLTWDTRIGLPLNRLYLEELADTYREMLLPMRTYEQFEEWVANDDCPGGGAHPNVRNELKGRQAGKINTLADYPVHVLGLRADESNPRAQMEKVEQRERHIEVRPVHRLSKTDCARIILEHEECPINPCWLWNHASDCFCLANGDPSELDAVEEKFPWFAQRIREIEEAAEADGLRGTLGWDGLVGPKKKAKQQGQQQMTLCGQGCQRERDPAVVRAFRARINGATGQEAIDILDGNDTSERRIAAATDGGSEFA